MAAVGLTPGAERRARQASPTRPAAGGRQAPVRLPRTRLMVSCGRHGQQGKYPPVPLFDLAVVRQVPARKGLVRNHGEGH